jgi:major tropism determinant Mtd-like protein
MSEQLQLRRGTAAQVAAFTGAPGEIVIDTTNNRLVVQDGATAGGFPAARLGEVAARRAVADAATTILPNDRLVAFASLTATRAATLCAASAYPQGAILAIIDESGACSPANRIVVGRAGADTINGATSLSIAAPYGSLVLESNGVNAWTALARPVGFADLAGGVSPAQAWPAVMIGGWADNVNFNSANTDTPIAIALPAGVVNYKVNSLAIANASASLTNAAAGLFTAAGGAGVEIASGNTTLTVSAVGPAINNNLQLLTINNPNTMSYSNSVLYFRVTTAQGELATASAIIYINPLP